MNDSNILLGETFKKTRQAKGLTQEYVAEKLNLGSRYISDLERNKSLGGISTLIKLCNLYQVTPTYILSEYLDIPEELKIDKNLIGFYSLTESDKDTIIKLIEYMNSKKNIL